MSIKKEIRLIQDVSDFMRLKHYPIHTKKSDYDGIKRYVSFH